MLKLAYFNVAGDGVLRPATEAYFSLME